MTKLAVFALLFVGTVALVGGQEITFGFCPPSKAMTNFNWNSFKGKWYTTAKLWQGWDLKYKCIHDIYLNVPPAINTILEVGRTSIETGERDYINGRVWVPNPTRGEYIVKFPNTTLGQSLTVQVLGTDYNNWALLYGCINLFFHSFEFAWVKQRSQMYWPGTADPAYNLYASLGFNKTKLLPVLHDPTSCGLY